MPFQDGEESVDLESHLITDGAREHDESDDFEKKAVMCICPKCSKSHFMKMHWIGRGTPRKFCRSCQNIYYYVENA